MATWVLTVAEPSHFHNRLVSWRGRISGYLEPKSSPDNLEWVGGVTDWSQGEGWPWARQGTCLPTPADEVLGCRHSAPPASPKSSPASSPADGPSRLTDGETEALLAEDSPVASATSSCLSPGLSASSPVALVSSWGAQSLATWFSGLSHSPHPWITSPSPSVSHQ